jgi:hypothetical protein
MSTATAEIVLGLLLFSPMICLSFIIISEVVGDYIST